MWSCGHAARFPLTHYYLQLTTHLLLTHNSLTAHLLLTSYSRLTTLRRAPRQVVMQLLQQAHPCQTAGVEADELGVDDEADHDEALWEAVSELLTSLPKVLGAAWQAHFASLLPHLLPYLGAGHPASDRSLAVGVIAESMHQLEAEAAPLVASVMPIALRHSADEDATCRQNATFCLGVMSQYCPAQTLGHMQHILTALQPRLAAEEVRTVDQTNPNPNPNPNPNRGGAHRRSD